MKKKSKAVWLFSMLVLAFSMLACEKEGPAEKAGRHVDQALDTAKDKIHDATN